MLEQAGQDLLVAQKMPGNLIKVMLCYDILILIIIFFILFFRSNQMQKNRIITKSLKILFYNCSHSLLY